MTRAYFDRLDNSSTRSTKLLHDMPRVPPLASEPHRSIARLADDAPVPHADSWAAPDRPKPPLPPKASAASEREIAPYVQKAPLSFITMDEACDALRAKAPSTARGLIKDRARAYALKPRQLEAIAEGMSRLPPRTLVTALRQIDAVAIMRGTRWAGFGGEVPAINFKAAMWYARYSRAKQHQLSARDA